MCLQMCESGGSLNQTYWGQCPNMLWIIAYNVINKHFMSTVAKEQDCALHGQEATERNQSANIKACLFQEGPVMAKQAKIYLQSSSL